MNILYKGAFEKLGIDKTRLKPTRMPLSGFTGDQVEAEGTVELSVELGSPPNVFNSMMEFVVVNISCVHNAILGRPGITRAGAVISMAHLCMKFYTPNGIGVVRGNQWSARRCYLEVIKKINEMMQGSTRSPNRSTRARRKKGRHRQTILRKSSWKSHNPRKP